MKDLFAKLRTHGQEHSGKKDEENRKLKETEEDEWKKGEWKKEKKS